LQGNIDPRLLFASREEMEKTLKVTSNSAAKTKTGFLTWGMDLFPVCLTKMPGFLADWVKNYRLETLKKWPQKHEITKK
jgi:uroporphyrinogen-III decarboxylase